MINTRTIDLTKYQPTALVVGDALALAGSVSLLSFIQALQDFESIVRHS
jgi:hypothetical protein